MLDSTSQELLLPDPILARLGAWVRDAYPHEACGLLVGRVDGAGVEVVRAVRAGNLNRERAHERYELDPADHMQTELAARAEGLDVVGVWHSHPDHQAVPSETDRAAAHAGWSYVILSVAPGGVSDVRSWRLRSGRFREEAISPYGRTGSSPS